MGQTLGERLRALRKERYLTLEEVGKAAVLSTSYVNDLEHDRARPRLDTLVRLGTALGISSVEILRGISPYDTNSD